ncbi:MAG TPA: Gfo/Idh/MocA family oxidoreductase [Verrucomicrobiae bacterium]|nr:Gfo/Idh/MocA family oxidoreductase [Verrucomicrobiae bacterium]
MNSVRFGIVGVGNMGWGHAEKILSGKVSRCQITAVCDPSPAKFARFPDAKGFTRSEELIRSGTVDAVLIATPHFDHTTIGIDALRHGLHVLVEKPISVHKADAERLIAAHKGLKQVFAAMFNQRTDPYYRKLREMIQGGELGPIRRINWTITNWFRPDAYYKLGAWRATWAGEGGGVLLNQCPHNLDLFQWLFGMPQRVRGFCQLGRYHDIEVEDDVTAYFEYADGATAVFIASTGEAPGTDRLEVAADNGRLVFENDALVFRKNETPASEFSRTTTKPFSMPAATESKFTFPDHGGQHVEVLRNFVDAILDGKPLVAPAVEGLHSVELANAILFSSAHNQTIELPLDAAAYEKHLEQKIATSRFQRSAPRKHGTLTDDLANSFNR